MHGIKNNLRCKLLFKMLYSAEINYKKYVKKRTLYPLFIKMVAEGTNVGEVSRLVMDDYDRPIRM